MVEVAGRSKGCATCKRREIRVCNVISEIQTENDWFVCSAVLNDQNAEIVPNRIASVEAIIGTESLFSMPELQRLLRKQHTRMLL